MLICLFHPRSHTFVKAHHVEACLTFFLGSLSSASSASSSSSFSSSSLSSWVHNLHFCVCCKWLKSLAGKGKTFRDKDSMSSPVLWNLVWFHTHPECMNKGTISPPIWSCKALAGEDSVPGTQDRYLPTKRHATERKCCLG